MIAFNKLLTSANQLYNFICFQLHKNWNVRINNILMQREKQSPVVAAGSKKKTTKKKKKKKEGGS